MEIVWILIPISLVLVGVIAWAFLWAVNSGQFDDLEGPAHRILADDDRVEAAVEAETNTKTKRDAKGTEQPPAL